MPGEPFGIIEEPLDIKPKEDDDEAPWVPDEAKEEEATEEAAKTDTAADVPADKEVEPEEKEEAPEGAEETAAEDDAGGEEQAAEAGPEISRDVYRAAVLAGLTDEQIDSLGSDAAVKTATEVIAKAHPEDKGTETREEPAPEEEWPELPAWDVEVPEELLSEESAIDPKTGKVLKAVVDKFKEREDVFRAQIEYLRKQQPKDSGAETWRDLVWNSKLDKFMQQDDAGKMVGLFGDGLDFEVSQQEFENRQKLRSATDALWSEQKSRGVTPKLVDVMRQAYAITFPKEYQQAEKDKIRPKLKARQAQRISKPTTGKKEDTRSPRQRAIDNLRAKQEKLGVAHGKHVQDDDGFVSPF